MCERLQQRRTFNSQLHRFREVISRDEFSKFVGACARVNKAPARLVSADAFHGCFQPSRNAGRLARIDPRDTVKHYSTGSRLGKPFRAHWQARRASPQGPWIGSKFRPQTPRSPPIGIGGLLGVCRFLWLGAGGRKPAQLSSIRRNRSTSSAKLLSVVLSSSILRTACITVVWSRPPNLRPISGNEREVNCLARYIAT